MLESWPFPNRLSWVKWSVLAGLVSSLEKALCHLAYIEVGIGLLCRGTQEKKLRFTSSGQETAH